MDSLKPADIVANMVQAGIAKSELGVFDLLVRGALSGALLGFATSLAIGATTQTAQPIVGALIFPVGFVMIVLLGLELVTGSFAIVPLAFLRGRASAGTVLVNWSWVFVGNLLGSLLYAGLLAIALTMAGRVDPAGVAASIVKIAEMKTLGYAHFGMAGLVTVFVKAMLCNWMVCLGVVMAMSSTSTIGRIAGAWMRS
jgi:formate/nitrite transporter FocA (FNT family)